MNTAHIGVLRGGPGNEYEVSLKTGASILEALRNHKSEQYHSYDIVVDRSGAWYLNGIATAPERLYGKVDAIFNALHGAYGEDGKVQSILETHAIPFTGSGSLASALGMNKVLTKKILKDHGIKTPTHEEFTSKMISEDAQAIVRKLFRSFILPGVVKPAASGSSVGVSIVRGYDQLPEALKLAAEHGAVVIVEEYIPGVEATCGVIDGFRGRELYALPVVEIRPKASFFDYKAKYSPGMSEEIVPATFGQKIKSEIEELSKKIHGALSLRHYSRSDFIIHPRRGIYALEVNTLPGLTDESLFPKALRAAGSDLGEFLEHVIGLAVG